MVTGFLKQVVELLQDGQLRIKDRVALNEVSGAIQGLKLGGQFVDFGARFSVEKLKLRHIFHRDVNGVHKPA